MTKGMVKIEDGGVPCYRNVDEVLAHDGDPSNNLYPEVGVLHALNVVAQSLFSPAQICMQVV